MKRVRSVWHDLASCPEEADDLAERAEAIINLGKFLEGVDPQEAGLRYGVDAAVIKGIQNAEISKLSAATLRGIQAAISKVEGPL